MSLPIPLSEARPGMVPPDPLLAAIPAVEVAVTTFLVLYLGIAAALWALFRAPLALLRALHAYVLLLLLRIGGVVPTAVASGYLPEDCTLDGEVRYTGAGNDRDPLLMNIGGSTPTAVRIGQLP